MRFSGFATMGVVGLGALVGAVVLATTTSGFRLPLPVGPAPKRGKGKSTGTKATVVKRSDIPSHAVDVTPSKASSARTVKLIPGVKYRADLKLSGVQTMATNAQVTEKLAEIGPWSVLSVTGSGAERVAIGTYAGKAKQVALPPEVQSVTEMKAGTSKVAPAASPPALPPPNPEQPALAQEPPAPAAAKRTSRQAAQELYDYVTPLIRRGQSHVLTDESNRNEIVHKAQQDMGGKQLLAALAKGQGGIYGPLTRARGKELLGREFPKA